MALKKYKPTTPSQRQLVLVDRSALHKGAPVKSLFVGLKLKGKDKRPIETWRCGRCGYLENYAR